ncbi:UDP-N-acetylglucosamine 2-epimerase [Candidatus Micrarchaeota archaeon]|nr:UDP-N-acetylglucosamine 2-epimerase [Candidatus Micrarchaeota archaeon]
MRSVVFVLGTRAEAIKVLPVISELRKRGHSCRVISTGQHDLREFRFPHFTELRPPTGISGTFNSSFEGMAFVAKNIHRIRKLVRNCIVVVQGDTMSTTVGSIAGRLASNATVCHIESGLRTYDFLQPYPEEISRVIADRLSHVHFAPTQRAAAVTPRHSTHLVGNTVIDSIRSRRLKVKDDGFLIFSIHRQENINSSSVMTRLVKNVVSLSRHFRILFILSKNTQKKLVQYGLYSDVTKHCRILSVLPYEKFLPLLARCTAVVSDSGGLAEECAYLQKPLVIFRKKTERFESVEHGYALLGFDFDLREFIRNFKPRAKHIYGRGDSGKRIVDVLEQLEKRS